MSDSVPNLHVRRYHPDDKDAVIALWEQCGLTVPANDPKADIDAKLCFQPELFLVGAIDDRLVATAMVGYDGHRGWINYLGVAPDVRGRGVGRRIMAAAEAKLRELGCPKINLQVRTANRAVAAFYERLGFKVDDVLSMGKRLD